MDHLFYPCSIAILKIRGYIRVYQRSFNRIFVVSILIFVFIEASRKHQLEHFVMDGRADQRDYRWPRCAPKHGEVAGKLWKKSKNMEQYSKSRKYRCKESHPSTVQIPVWLLQTVWPVRRQNSTVQILKPEASWHCTTLQEGSAGQLLVRSCSCSCRRCQVRHQRFRFVFQFGAVKFSHAVQRHGVAEPISWVRKLESQGESVEFGKSNLKFGLCVPFLPLFARYILNPQDGVPWISPAGLSWANIPNYFHYHQFIGQLGYNISSVSIFTGSCFACGISLPLCFIIAQVPKQKKTHGTQFFQIDAAGLFSPLCAVHCFWCMRVLC